MAVMGISDLWEPHTTAMKIGQIKGATLMVRLLMALPEDARSRISEAVAKKEIS